MTRGTVVKLVDTHGSTWGRVRADGSLSDLFFNRTSLVEGTIYENLHEGDSVEFDEQPDRANGTHADNMRHLPSHRQALRHPRAGAAPAVSRSSSALRLIAAAWRDAGLQAAVGVSGNGDALCCLPECRAMTFVELRTNEGVKRLCFKHFQAVQQTAESITE
jgi:cold shock CspA family protein